MISQFLKSYWQLSLSLILLSCGFLKESKKQSLKVIAGDNYKELDRVSEYYKSDSRKLSAYNFLLDHLQNQSSVFSFFLSGKDTIWLTDNACNDTVVTMRVNCLGAGFNPSSISVRDASVLNSEFLIENIDQAFIAYNNYKWAKITSFDTFCKYVVPYKVSAENLDRWRPFFYKRLKSKLDSLNLTFAPTSYQVFRIIEKDVSQWMHFNATSTVAGSFHGIVQLSITQNGDCFDYANLYVYALRTFGIPATVDYVPLWGSQNGSHAEVVFQDSTLRMTTLDSGRLSGSAKVFRATYETIADNNMEKLKVLPLLKQYSNGQYKDVTDEHNLTNDLEYAIPYDGPEMVSVICIFNYGRWVPAFTGKFINNNKTIFSKMGRNIIYRFAVLNRGTLDFISQPFLLNKQGQMTFPKTDKSCLLNLSAKKINHGDLSWIKKGIDYELYYYDKNNWEFHQKKQATKDSLIVFNEVPSNTFYRVIADDNSYLSRIFLYQDSLQVWH